MDTTMGHLHHGPTDPFPDEESDMNKEDLERCLCAMSTFPLDFPPLDHAHFVNRCGYFHTTDAESSRRTGRSSVGVDGLHRGAAGRSDRKTSTDRDFQSRSPPSSASSSSSYIASLQPLEHHQHAVHVNDDGHPLQLKMRTQTQMHRLFLEHSKHRLTELKDRLKNFGSRVALPANPFHLQRDGEQLLSRIDEDLLPWIVRFNAAFRTMQMAHGVLHERERQVAKQCQSLLQTVSSVRQLALCMDRETHGNVRLRRLHPSSKLRRRCEKAFHRLDPSRSYAVVEVFQLQNRALVRKYDEKAMKHHADEVKGLLRQIHLPPQAGVSGTVGGGGGGDGDVLSDLPETGKVHLDSRHRSRRSRHHLANEDDDFDGGSDAAQREGRPWFCPELTRLLCFGWGNARSPEEHELFRQTIFPFWRQPKADMKFGSPFGRRLRFYPEADALFLQEYSSGDGGGGGGNGVGFDCDGDSNGTKILVLNRVVAGRSLQKSDATVSEDDSVFEVFPSVWDASRRCYELEDMDRVLPEFIYVVQRIDQDRFSGPLLPVGSSSTSSSGSRPAVSEFTVVDSDGVSHGSWLRPKSSLPYRLRKTVAESARVGTNQTSGSDMDGVPIPTEDDGDDHILGGSSTGDGPSTATGDDSGGGQNKWWNNCWYHTAPYSQRGTVPADEMNLDVVPGGADMSLMGPSEYSWWVGSVRQRWLQEYSAIRQEMQEVQMQSAQRVRAAFEFGKSQLTSQRIARDGGGWLGHMLEDTAIQLRAMTHHRAESLDRERLFTKIMRTYCQFDMTARPFTGGLSSDGTLWKDFDRMPDRR